MPAQRKKSPTTVFFNGEVACTVPGFVLVRRPDGRRAARTDLSARASSLLPKVARALDRPGISQATVFKGHTRHVYAYSVDATDTSRVIRTSADGQRTVGRLVGKRFVPLKNV